jgi:group I intron endonuclease
MKFGVYKITNTTNGHAYVGSSANKSRQGIDGRMRDHRTNLLANKHCNAHLQHAWNKYGADAFVFEVLLYCDPEHCLMHEQIALDYYKPEYNIAPTAGSSLGRKHSDETIEHFKKIRNTPKFKLAASARMQRNTRCIGRQLSEITKTNISKARSGQRNYHKLNLSDVQTIKVLLAQQISQSAIAKRFNISQSTISMIKNKKRWN